MSISCVGHFPKVEKRKLPVGASCRGIHVLVANTRGYRYWYICTLRLNLLSWMGGTLTTE